MFKTFITVLFSLFIIACDSTPSDSEIKQQISEHMTVPDLFEILKVNKTNGWMDDKQYVCEVEYTIIFSKNLADAAKSSAKNNDPFGGLFSSIDNMSLKMKYGNFKAGDTKTYSATFRFRDTEQGWRLITDGQ